MVYAFTYNFVFLYFIAKIVLRVHGEKASLKQKILFAFLVGTVLNSASIYLIYYLGGMLSFPPLKHLLVTTPNPITALFYCLFGITILKLSSTRSIDLMGTTYLYVQIINCFLRLIGSVFFVQNAERYNYLLNFLNYLSALPIVAVVFILTMRALKKKPNLILSKTYTFARPGRDLLGLFIKSCSIYFFMVVIPTLVENQVVANLLVFTILSLLFVASMYSEAYYHAKTTIRKKDDHLVSIAKSVEEFQAVKHDFYNILQAYNGYFEMGDLEACRRYHTSLTGLTVQAGELLDLAPRMSENPALVALLIDKYTYAQKENVGMSVNLKCTLSGLPMDDIDLCRVMACLLNNAVEAACETERKRVSLTIEQNAENSWLIILMNSSQEPPELSQIFIKGVTTKDGHQGIGLNTVRKLVDKYANCSFQINYHNDILIAYLELKNCAQK